MAGLKRTFDQAPCAKSSRTGYVGGCRCEGCTKANREYQRRYWNAHYAPEADRREVVLERRSRAS